MLAYKRQHSMVATQLARAEDARAALEGEVRSVEVCWSGVSRGGTIWGGVRKAETRKGE